MSSKGLLVAGMECAGDAGRSRDQGTRDDLDLSGMRDDAGLARQGTVSLSVGPTPGSRGVLLRSQR